MSELGPQSELPLVPEREKSEEVKLPNWEKESERQDIKHLREVLLENASIEDIIKSTNEPFSMGPEDIAYVYKLSANYRKSKGLEAGDVDKDYSVWSQVCLSFMSHKMKECGVNQPVLEAFKDIISLRTKFFIEFPEQYKNKKEVEMTDEASKNYGVLFKEKEEALKSILSASEEFSKFEKVFNWSIKYFKLMDQISFNVRYKYPSKTVAEDPLLGKIPRYMDKYSEKAEENGYNGPSYHEFAHSISLYQLPSRIKSNI